jgi:hypothetical protein
VVLWSTFLWNRGVYRWLLVCRTSLYACCINVYGTIPESIGNLTALTCVWECVVDGAVPRAGGGGGKLFTMRKARICALGDTAGPTRSLCAFAESLP